MYMAVAVSVEQYNSLVDRVAHLEALAQANWDAGFTPARGPIATPRPTQPVKAAGEDETPLTGALNLRIVPMATTEKALTNCVYFNTGNEIDSGAQYLAYTRNMYIMRAVYDPTLPPGTIETGLFTRLNAEMPMNCKRNFFKMGVDGAEPCRSVAVSLARVGRPVDGDDGAPPSIEDIRTCLNGQSIDDTGARRTQIFVVTKPNGVVYKATVNEAIPGILTNATGIVVRM